MADKNRNAEEFADAAFEASWAEGVKSGDATLEIEVPGDDGGPDGFPVRVRGRFRESEWSILRETPSGKRKELFDRMGELLRDGSFSEAAGEALQDSKYEILYWLEMRRWMLEEQMEDFVKTITSFHERA